MDIIDFLKKHGLPGDRLGDTAVPCDVFDRHFGAELAGWELRLVGEFEEHVRNIYRYRGFVHHTRDRCLILLTPSPWLLDGVLIRIPEDARTPDEGEMIEVSGRHAMVQGRGTSGDLVGAILAESIERVSEPFLSDVRPPLTLRDLSGMLFEHVGMSETAKGVFARLFVSSPPYLNAIGGLSTGILALTSWSQVRRFLSFMRRVIPPSMRSVRRTFREVRGMRVRLPRIWRMEMGRVSRKTLRRVCTEREDPHGYREVSVGTMTDDTTAALPDVPLALASEDFWIESRDPTSLQLPILKSAITFQLMTPTVSERSVESGMKHILSRLEYLQDSFEMPESALTRGHVLDADVLGRPLGVLKLARSTARAAWKTRVTAKDIRREWDRVLEPALREFLELARLKDDVTGERGERPPIHRYDSRVFRAVRRLDQGTRGSFGPTLDEIAAEAGVEQHVAARTLAMMKNDGVIYEPRPGRFRLV